jgi:hypothetical protein
VLRACHRSLKPGGRIAFYTIFIAPGASPAERRRAIQAGPPGVYSSASQPALLRSAGFHAVRDTDVTREYLRVARAWHAARERHAEALIAISGEGEYRSGQEEREEHIRVIEAGVLRRGFLVAERPATGRRRKSTD